MKPSRHMARVQGQPEKAGEKRLGWWVWRFSLGLASVLLALGLMPGPAVQAVGSGAVPGQAGMLDTLEAQVRTVVAGSTRFLDDLQLIYRMLQLREGREQLDEVAPVSTPPGDAKLQLCKKTVPESELGARKIVKARL